MSKPMANEVVQESVATVSKAHPTDLSLFKTINQSMDLGFLNDILPYVLGYKSPIYVIGLLVILGILVAVKSPKHGPSAVIGSALLSIGAFFATGPIGSMFYSLRPSQFLGSGAIVRLDYVAPGSDLPSLVPLICGILSGVITFYFPRKGGLIGLLGLGATLATVYLGVHMPFSAFTSYFLGIAASVVYTLVLDAMGFKN